MEEREKVRIFSPRSVDVVVLGTGSKVERVDPAIRSYLQRKGISLEIQDTVRSSQTTASRVTKFTDTLKPLNKGHLGTFIRCVSYSEVLKHWCISMGQNHVCFMERCTLYFVLFRGFRCTFPSLPPSPL